MKRTDYWIVLLLIALCGLFYWRLFTFNDADAISFTTIDITTQFTPWSSYAVERIHDGELPLWNPYMYGGTSFIADPQNVLFYPVRWLTIGWLAFDSNIANSDILFALENEMVFHVFLGTLFMYAYLRRHTSPAASLCGALVWGFGGYMTSYPAAQLPILETAVWIPLILFSIDRIRGTDDIIRWRWVLVSGCVYGLSILAGHTQTSMLTGYFALSYIVYVLWGQHLRTVIPVIGLFALVAIGLSAIQILPTAEFQLQTTRTDFSIEHKGTGFAWHEIGMVLFPHVLGDWAPLYVGIITLGLVGVAIWRERVGYWVGVSVVAFVLAFGQRTVLYSLFYLLVPGFSFFRSQERAVVILTVAVSVMVAHGVNALLEREWGPVQRRYLLGGWSIFIIMLGLFTAIFWMQRPGKPADSIESLGAQSSMFSLLLALGSLFVFIQLLRRGRPAQWLVAALLIFDLFSINMNNPFNFDRVPVDQQLIEPEYIATIRDNTLAGQTVDGQRGIGFSNGALYRVRDIYGTGSLRLKAFEFYLYQLPPERRWELLGVQVVTSGEDDLPVPNTWLGQGRDELGEFYIYRIDNQRAFALLYYDSEQVSSPETAWDKVADPAFPLRETVILEEGLPQDLSREGTGQINLLTFEPEYIELRAETDSPAVASFVLPYVTGWQATVDGEEVEALRTFGGLTGVYLDPGQHRIVLRYMPVTFIWGAAITGITLLGVIGAFVVMAYQSRRRRDQQPA